MDEQKVEMGIRTAVFELSDGGKVFGEVFLRLYEAHHAGPQTVGDLLNGELTFLPVKTAQRILLLNVGQIVSVEVRLEEERDELMTMGKKYGVVLVMPGGRERRGDVYVNLPEQSSRFKDYINQPARFFPLFQSEWIVYVNRQYVLFAHD